MPLDEFLVLLHPSHNRKQKQLRVLVRINARLWPVCVLRLVGRRADFSRIFIFEKSWSKRKQAFEPQGAMMDTHTLPLIACAWQLLCEMPSSQGSRDGVGTPPQDRPLGRR